MGARVLEFGLEDEADAGLVVNAFRGFKREPIFGDGRRVASATAFRVARD